MPPQGGSSEASFRDDQKESDPKFSPFRVELPPTRFESVTSPYLWLDAKKQVDNVGNLWRIHDKLYDLTDFIDKHPGGKFWLEKTRGWDITEVFESSHPSPAVERLLPKYFVRDADGPRNARFTFHEDGFYRTLKRKAWEVLKKVGCGPSLKMRMLIDGMVALFLSLLVAAAMLRSYVATIMAGTALSIISAMAHNFLHQKDNFRMFYIDLSLNSHHSWRLTHSLSHHLFPNTFYDFETHSAEPFLYLHPVADKWMFKPIMLLMTLIGFAFGLFVSYLSIWVEVFSGYRKFSWESLLVLTELAVMAFIAENLVTGLCLWLVMHISCNFLFSITAHLSSHQHPDIYHSPDRFRDDPDWGLCQMDALRDKIDITGSLFLVTGYFGDHSLHHLFPTVDHSKLPYLYPAFLETCKEFNVPYTFKTQSYFLKGFFSQLLNTSPNMNPPGYNENDEQLLPKNLQKLVK